MRKCRITQWIYDLADKLERSFKKMVRTFLPTIPLPNNGVATKSPQLPAKPEEEEIKYQEKIRFTDRLKVLKPEELGQLVQKIVEICPLAFREVEGQKAQILVDNMDVFSFKQVVEFLGQLEEIDDSIAKRQKLQ